MRIISPFKDYYDGASYLAFSDDTIYLRKTIEHYDGADYGLDRSSSYFYNYFSQLDGNFEFQVIFFCGKAYPFAKVKLGKKTSYIFNKKECEDIVDQKRIEKYVRYGYRLDFQHFDKFNNYKLNEVYNCPIILIKKERSNDRNSRNVIILNPPLNALEFYKIVDSNTCYQEIFMWMNSIYKNDKPIAEIEDTYRIQQHGFDKASFRKSPTKKKINNV